MDISKIRTDGGTQPRATVDDALVTEYAEAMSTDAIFPPVTVFHDGTDHWLADGFHRVRAARQIGKDEIEADIRQGTQRDAILYSVGANAAHGQRRTNPDKKRSVLRLLEDDEWAKWSDREIARQCVVSAPFVATVKESLTVNSYSEPGPTAERTYTTKHGTTATMNTENIGRQGTEPQREPEPDPMKIPTQDDDSREGVKEEAATIDQSGIHDSTVITTMELIQRRLGMIMPGSEKLRCIEELTKKLRDWSAELRNDTEVSNE